MTTSSWLGRLVPTTLRPARPDVADGAVPDGDLLGWLGFVPGESEVGPLLRWPRPTARPTLRRGRHRAPRPSAA